MNRWVRVLAGAIPVAIVTSFVLMFSGLGTTCCVDAEGKWRCATTVNQNENISEGSSGTQSVDRVQQLNKIPADSGATLTDFHVP